jgi:hypothetical protein
VGLLRPPHFTWRWPAAERDVTRLLRRPGEKFQFVDKSDRPRRPARASSSVDGLAFHVDGAGLEVPIDPRKRSPTPAS